MKKQLVAVYGSLRQGMGNHQHYLKNANYLGEFTTEPIFTLHTLGGYPGLKENGTTAVVMEVYEVDDETAERIDGLEGYTPGKKSYFYDKITIETPYGTAGVYIYVSPLSKDSIVESGDWKEFKEKIHEFYSIRNN